MNGYIKLHRKLVNWDDPENENIPFPNHRVGIGKTKDESFKAFMKHEAKRQKLLEKIKGDMR